jgi:hypothetical protein
MHYPMRNDNKIIISALNDKKRNGQKLTIGGQKSSGPNSISKSVQQMTKSVLKSVYMIKSDKSYCHLLSFLLFWAVTHYHLLSKSRPYSVPRPQKCPPKTNSNLLNINNLRISLLHSAWANEHSASASKH